MTLEHIDEHDWEYAEEAMAAECERKRFDRLPDTCKACRWLDWYYEAAYQGYSVPCSRLQRPWCRDHVEQKVMGAPPLKTCKVIGDWACPFWARSVGPFKPRWLWLLAIQLQYLLWNLRVGFLAWEINRRVLARYEAVLDSRAGKLLLQGKQFVTIAADEPYFQTVYGWIRSQEKARGCWTHEDEHHYQQAIEEWRLQVIGER